MVNLYYEKKFEIFESDCVFRRFFFWWKFVML